MGGQKWGGQLRPQPDGSYHATIWRASEGRKGERLSWEQEPDGSARSVHYTDQDTRTHSSDPDTWRAPSDVLVWLMLLVGVAWALCHALC